jgi:hypothetical protein
MAQEDEERGEVYTPDGERKLSITRRLRITERKRKSHHA